MSMINAAATYRRDDRPTMRVPVVMPLVEVTVDEEGILAVLLDREPYSADGALQRDGLERLLDGIATELGTPIRVEVREADDSTFTDIVTPDRPKPRMTKSAEHPATAIGEVGGRGFLPNEEVAVAVVVARQFAGTDGTARLRLPPVLLEAHPGLVVLMGQTSGTVTVSGGAA